MLADGLRPAILSIAEMQFHFKKAQAKISELMNVKIDTREKFHVITILDPVFTGNMTEEFASILNKLRETGVFNLILNLESLDSLDAVAAGFIAAEQQRSYEQQQSFVICCIKPALEEWLDENGILELLNSTPTESEAWDIVQMEEIERELGY